MPRKSMNIVVAMCNHGGIGINGNLPWRLKGDMAFFKRITTSTRNPKLKNAVIMGRKTWESIPEKFRPLKDRLNVIVSNTVKDIDGALVASSWEDAVGLTDANNDIESVFVIGGNSIYKMALESGCCHRVYLTRVLKDFECDVFMPELSVEEYKLVEDPDLDPAVQTENDVQYKYEVYEKLFEDSIPLNIMVAFIEPSRGFGYNGDIPWPHIRKDFERYIGITSTRKCADKKNCYIKGKDTWLSTRDEERNNPDMISVVVSTTLPKPSKSESHHVCDSLDDALRLIGSMRQQIETVWVMGGQQVFKDVLALPQCTTAHVTRIFNQFPCDRFFPVFEHLFSLVKSDEHYRDLNTIYEDNGIRFQFELYHRKCLNLS